MTGIRSNDDSEIDDRRGDGNKKVPSRARTNMSSRQGSLVYPMTDSMPINQNKPLKGQRLLSTSQKAIVRPGVPIAGFNHPSSSRQGSLVYPTEDSVAVNQNHRANPPDISGTRSRAYNTRLPEDKTVNVHIHLGDAIKKRLGRQ